MKPRHLFAPAAAATLLTALPATAEWSHREGDPMPAAGYSTRHFSREDWDASNHASEEDLEWFRDAKYGMFIHFGLSTHNNAELSWGTCRTRKAPDVGRGPVADEIWTKWPEEFVFENFNAKETVATAKRGGFRYIVAIAKHHEGFHLWDTDHSDFNVMNTPFGRDYLKELADACHADGMRFGIYYSQRDWYHPDYMPVDPEKVVRNGTQWTLKPGETSPLGERHKKYIKYQFDVCRELCTKYGKIDVFWFDAAWHRGMFTEEMWDSEKLMRMIRELQPGILINNRASLPGDFDTPEQRLGNFQNWRPWESCMCLTRSWSFSGTPPKSRDQIISMIVNNACGDGNVLLSWGPDWSGRFAEAETQRLLEVGAWLEHNGRAIYGTRGGPWKNASWGGSPHRDSTCFLHITRWSGDTLRLPALPGRKVLGAKLLNGGTVQWKQLDGTLEITVPADLRDPADTIVELTMDASLEDLAAVEAGEVSMFHDSSTFGQIISRRAKVSTSSRHPADPGKPESLVAAKAPADFAFHTKEETNPWVVLDLGNICQVTGLRVLNRIRAGRPGVERAASLRLSVSTDGATWQEAWHADSAEEQWEIPLSSVRAGAEVPGREARHLRLELRNSEPTPLHLRQIEVWGTPE
ncbi:MAG: alpha-L-fucosidase [Akkermansiaceae bacterium]|nr:alpha-L-fucosidase [Akkermansiaceae bacterium]